MGISLFKGILIGILLSLPFGPVGIYCIELTILEGHLKGYVAALGMVTVDIFYSFISLVLLSKIQDFIIKYENKFSLFIGIFFLVLSLKKLLSKVEIKEVNIEYKGIIQNYFIGFLFAIANITSILFITGIFTALKVYNNQSIIDTYQILFGVLKGGASIWFLTTSIVSYCGKNIYKNKLSIVVKYVNIILLFFSLILILKSLIKFIRI